MAWGTKDVTRLDVAFEDPQVNALRVEPSPGPGPPHFAYSDRGPFAVTPTPGRPAGGGGVLGLPEKLGRAALEALGRLSPQRATDIFYEDDDKVFVMRDGIQYSLTPPASTVWRALGKRVLSDIVEEAATQLGAKDQNQLWFAVGEFLLAASHHGLVILDPES